MNKADIAAAISRQIELAKRLGNPNIFFSISEGEILVALLKEQKGEPKLVTDKQYFGDCISAFCPNCGRGLYDNNMATRYCYNCGQAVKWK